MTDTFDVLLIGAGISGINAAYRIQTQCPHLNYAILEARHGMGGTWDFFKYPGIRSDSDLYTFGFPWAPWQEQRAIADGASIKAYIEKTAASQGIDRKIRYGCKVMETEWRSDEQKWRVRCEVEGEKGAEEKVLYAGFVMWTTGYYDYAQPLPAQINGIENFKGKIVHPQFWPSDLDYNNKDVVIIGSGATAITLLPSMAEKASHVTMLQRSPSYILSLPNKGDWISRYLPTWLAYRINRWKALTIPYLFFLFCRRFPQQARAMVKKATIPLLPKNIPHDPHFEPTYNPWEQRLCFCPDGDFYESLHNGKADIATGRIKSMTDDTVQLESGQEIKADVIVTATGLKIQLAGGAKIVVDGEPLNIGSKFMWKGIMLQDLPNSAFCIGYTNASWTLGADAVAQTVCRLLNNMKKRGDTSFVPRLEDEETLSAKPTLNLNATYVQKAASALPKAGDKGQWAARTNYFSDMWTAKFGDVTTGLQFYRIST